MLRYSGDPVLALLEVTQTFPPATTFMYRNLNRCRQNWEETRKYDSNNNNDSKL